MKNSEPFGVVLLADDSGDTEQGHIEARSIGTLATISDWYQGNDGLLGITALGSERFRLLSASRQSDGLNVGEIEALSPESSASLPPQFAMMSELLRAVLDDLGRLYADVDKQYEDASWVGYRFAEVLPLSLTDKQHCLEMDDAVSRLEFLQPRLREFRDERTQ